MLRNRKTGQRFDQYGYPLTRQTLFSRAQKQSAEEMARAKAIDAIVENFVDTLPPSLTQDERTQAIALQRNLFEQNWDLVMQCQNETFRQALMTELSAALTQIEKTNGEDMTLLAGVLAKFKQPQSGKSQRYEPPSALMHFAQTIGMSALSSYAPVLTTALTLTSLLVPVAAQSSSTYTVHDGKPQDGQDLCRGASNCIQGWLSSLSGEIVTQYSRIIEQPATNSGGYTGTSNNNNNGNPGALKQLNGCVTHKLLGEIATTTLESTPPASSNSTQVLPTCVAYSGKLFGYDAMGQLTDVTKATCDAFQNSFPASTSHCLDTGAVNAYNWKQFGIIAGSVIGAVCLCGCVIGGAVIACKVALDSDSDCCSRPKNCC